MTEAAPVVPRSPGLFPRVVGIIFSPRATYERIVTAPRVVGTVLLVGLTIGVSQAVPQLTEAGRQAAIDAQAQQMERFTGQPLSDEAYAGLERSAPYRGYMMMAFAPVGVAVALVFFAGLYFVIFNVVLGGTATFKQVMAIVAHGDVISALGAVIAAPVQYAQGSASPIGPFTLGALLPMLDEASFLARFLGFISVFSIWGTIVTAIGFAVLYRRKTANIAIGLLALTALFAAVGATIMGIFLAR